jgi:uncharacterized protein (DUF1697 family)
MFAFIRAINIGGRRLTNERLLAPFREVALDDVNAYQAAGNVAFRSDRDPLELEADLSGRLAAAYGFEAVTFVRRAGELRTTLDAVRFPEAAVARSEGRTQVTFLSGVPTDDQITQAFDLVPPDDHVVFAERAWFWLPRGGVSGSVLPVARFERILGPMTMRTVGTVERMLARFGE